MTAPGEKDEEPPTELEMRNRHVQTTETMIRNWVMYSKLLTQRLGRPQTHKLVDMISDQARLEPGGDGNIIQKPVTGVDRDYREVENKIVEKVIPDDKRPTHGTKQFFKDKSYHECSTSGCNREAQHYLNTNSAENKDKKVVRKMCSQCKRAYVKTYFMTDDREVRFYRINE